MSELSLIQAPSSGQASLDAALNAMNNGGPTWADYAAQMQNGVITNAAAAADNASPNGYAAVGPDGQPLAGASGGSSPPVNPLAGTPGGTPGTVGTNAASTVSDAMQTPLMAGQATALQGQVNNPTLAPGTSFAGQNEQFKVQPGELLNPAQQLGHVGTGTQQVVAQQVDPNAYYQPPVTMDAATGNNTAQGTSQNIDPTTVGTAQAAQGTVDPNALVENNYDRILTQDVDANGVPKFAQAAVAATNASFAARGLGNSTMAAGAQTAAILQAALPLAVQDAQNYQQMSMVNLTNRQQTNMQNASEQFQASMQNLSNDQQMELQNTQNRQAGLLADQSFTNAARQFNAQSTEQNNQFFAGLASQIATFNASQANGVAQFNAGEVNTNARFDAQVNNQRDQFNTQNALVVDQANAQWRRTINTANTTTDNAFLATDIQNRFNVTQQAQNQLWQAALDSSNWAANDATNQQTLAANMAIASMNNQANFQLMDKQAQNQFFSQLGGLATRLLAGTFNNK